jgi:tetratricopeptide (TPR) repeat protein
MDRAEDAAAPRAYLEAARLAYSNYRHELARGLAERGLTTASDPQERHELAYLLGDITHDLGDMAAALTAFEQAQSASSSHAERCRAWIGCARVKRITEDLDGAFADLQRAEEVAEPHGLKEEEARLRSLRGNLYFPRGQIDACLREHQRSLDLARELGVPGLEAAALGGLGDAEYVRGRMRSAHALLTDCVALSHRSGFGRIEVAHDAQLANTMIYLCPQSEALARARDVATAASRIGHLRADLHATLVSLICLFHLQDWQGADSGVRHAQALVARLGARRFEQNCLLASAQIAKAEGRSQEALEELRRAAAVARQMGTGFLGPIICGLLATTLQEPDERRAALAEGEALIVCGCVGHNQLRFYPMAIDVALELSEWDNAERYARELETFCAPEPLPWSSYFVERARLLAAVARDGAVQTAPLQSLILQGESLGYVASLRKLRNALR